MVITGLGKTLNVISTVFTFCLSKAWDIRARLKEENEGEHAVMGVDPSKVKTSLEVFNYFICLNCLLTLQET